MKEDSQDNELSREEAIAFPSRSLVRPDPIGPLRSSCVGGAKQWRAIDDDDHDDDD